MKAKIVISALITLLVLDHYSKLNAQTKVSGDITADTTWTVSGSPYVLTGNIYVKRNATLTIEEGVKVDLGGNGFYIGYSGWGEYTSGVLKANGLRSLEEGN
jgi:hypothetical protein